MGWVYLAVALYTFRNAAGFMIWHEVRSYNQSKPDADDIFLGCFFGFFAGAFWPLYWAFRTLHYIHHKWIKDSEFNYSFWVPQPHEIESKQKKERRVQAERNQSILSYQRAINAEERANGLPLTDWKF